MRNLGTIRTCYSGSAVGGCMVEDMTRSLKQCCAAVVDDLCNRTCFVEAGNDDRDAGARAQLD